MKTLFSIVAACAALTAAPAMSATIVSGYVAEDQVVTNGVIDGTTYMPSEVFPDFANSDAMPDPTFEFSGEAWIFGFLGSSDPTYEDNFVIEASDYSYTLQFSVLSGDLNMGIAVESGLLPAPQGAAYVVNAGNGVYQIDGLTGTNTIFMDGITGSGNWLVDVVNIVDVEAVPLPASSLMLLAGLGGLGAMRRRKTA